MAKFCPECANPIVENNMPFCPKCGAKLPGTSAEVQPPPVQQPAVQQPTHPSYYTPPVTPPIKILPTSDIESKSNERSFHYSTIFYIVIILDLIISFLSGIISLSVYFDVTSNGYHHPLNIFFPIVFLINLILDLFLLNNMRKSRDSIDSDSCWLKCIFGFLGIFTIISGLYFLIISINMKRAYDARIR